MAEVDAALRYCFDTIFSPETAAPPPTAFDRFAGAEH
jgi:hypothetical protein